MSVNSDYTEQAPTPPRGPRGRPTRGRRVRRLAIGAAAALLGAGAIGVAISQLSPPASHAATLLNCAAAPSKCGYPDATNSGVPSAMVLKVVPDQVSSGTGWHYDAVNHVVDVTGRGAVVSGLSISDTLNISASHVTVKNDKIVTSGAYAISIRHATRVTVKNSTIAGPDSTSGRVNIGIGDLYGDSTGTTVSGNDISAFRTAISVSAGQITGNYIHGPGYQSGDHTNGILGSGTSQLTISHNTILNNFGQTDAISIDTSTGTVVSGKTIENNLLAGGSYPIYGGASLGNSTSGILIENNRFAQNYFAKSGQYGPVTYFEPGGSGNKWSGNVWDRTGQSVPAP